MPVVNAYVQLTEARVARDAWEEAYFSLTDLKSVLQSQPGFVGMHVLIHADDDLRVVVTVRWMQDEQIEAWLETQRVPRDVLQELHPPPSHISVQCFLEVT